MGPVLGKGQQTFLSLSWGLSLCVLLFQWHQAAASQGICLPPIISITQPHPTAHLPSCV